MVKIHFLQKVLKNWSSFRKKNEKKISITGGGSGPYMEFSIIDFIFFLNPSESFSYYKDLSIVDMFNISLILEAYLIVSKLNENQL